MCIQSPWLATRAHHHVFTTFHFCLTTSWQRYTTTQDGSDHEIFTDKRPVGQTGPKDTQRIIKGLFGATDLQINR